jgi:hypothetical protein
MMQRRSLAIFWPSIMRSVVFLPTRSRLVRVLIISLASAWCMWAAEPTSPLAPMPTAKDLGSATKMIRDLFPDLGRQAKPDDRSVQISTMVKQGGETSDLLLRYALLVEASNRAAMAGQVRSAVEAVALLGRTHDIPLPSMQVKALETVSKAISGEQASLDLALSALDVADTAIARIDFDNANKALRIAEASARECRDLGSMAKAKAKGAELKERRVEHAAYAKMLNDPLDPQYAFIVGRYRLLYLDEVDGSSLLTAGSDADLARLAAQEMRKPSDPIEQFRLGESWWTWSEGQKAPWKRRAQIRAVKWYQECVRRIPGIDQAIAGRKIKQVQESMPGVVAGTARITELVNAKVSVLAEGVAAYSNRDYRVSGIPNECVGMTIIQFAIKVSVPVNLRIDAPAVFYYATNMELPDREGWIKTSLTVKSHDLVYPVWKKSFAAGSVVFPAPNSGQDGYLPLIWTSALPPQ